jgi:segregation and condensation protein B
MQTESADGARLQRTLEALLFVASESLSIDRLAKLTGAGHSDVAAALAAVEQEFADRGVVLREVAGGYRFASSPAERAAVEAYLLPPKTSLSPQAMETVSIVAYLQPVTKTEIEVLRGVNVDGVISTLVDRGLIVEAGRKDVVGRPMLYKTTPFFLEAFGLRSLADLPPIEDGTETPAPIPLPLLERAAAARNGSAHEDESEPPVEADTAGELAS